MMAVHGIGIFESVNVTCIKRDLYLPGNVTSPCAVNIIDFITSQITVYIISQFFNVIIVKFKAMIIKYYICA